MKPLINYSLSTLYLFAILFLLHSCSPEAPGCWKNEQIDAGKRQIFHELNDQAFKYLKAGDTKGLQDLLSKEMIDDPYTNRQANLLSYRLNSNDYSLFSEYYVVNKWRDRDTIKNGGIGINNYNLNYDGTAREMYIAFFLPKTGNNKWMITMVYCKFDYGWKIYKSDLGSYTINGKTAPELYAQAKDKKSKNNFYETTMAMAESCIKPSYLWEYAQDSLISDFYRKTLEEANNTYHFPFIVNQVATHPQIFRIFTETNDEGTYPTIYYLSAINLKDTAALKKENESIKKVIGKVIPGIDGDKGYLYYSAFNELIHAGKTTAHFDMIQQVK